MKFICLANLIINPSAISTIQRWPHVYQIHMRGAPIQGSILFGSGEIHSECIEVSEVNSPEDYHILSKWITEHVPESK